MPVERAITRRTILQLMAAQGGTLALAGCAGGEGITGALIPSASALPVDSALMLDPAIIAVTTRKPAGDGSKQPWFGPERSGGTRAVRVRYVPPGGSLVGRVSSAVTGRWRVDAVEPLGKGDPVAALADQAAGRDVLVYVHGYHESFETSAISAAELSDGIKFSGATVLFAWPSKEALLDYGYDRESALWSRDAFQEVLESLVRNAMVGRVHLVAHSMGALLALETLRQLWSAGGTGDVDAKFGAIVLAAPDIDIDLFATTVKRIGPLARHVTVISSTGDRALAVSERLAGGVSRVGAAERERLEPLGIKVVDASDYGNWRLIRHDLFLSNGDVRAVVKRALERGGQA